MSVLLALLLAASPATTSQVEPEFCFARNTATCRARRLARQARVYGVPSLDRLQREGVIARRTFFFDQNDQDVVAIILTRRRGARPLLTVLRPGGGAPGPSVSAPLTEVVWRELLAASRHFDAPAPSLQSAEGQTICFDSWLVHVEAADPGRAPREALRATCPGGAAVTYAYGLAARAVRLLPDCNLLEDRHFASDLTRLNYCTRLAGDRSMAARAANVAFALGRLDLSRDVGQLPDILAVQTELDWDGEHVAGRAAVAARLVRGFAAREALFFSFDRFTGHPDGSAETDGHLSEYIRDGEDERLGYRVDQASARFHLRRGTDGRFRIDGARIGVFVRRVYGRPRPEQ